MEREPILAPPHRRHRFVVPLAILVVVLLLIGLVGAAVVRDAPEDDKDVAAGREQTIAVTPDGAPAGLTGTAADIAAEIPGMMRFVEQSRGLAYKEPVEVILLGDDAFRERLKALDDEADAAERERTENNEHVFRALGLIEGDVDLEKATESLLGDAVAGFYDTEKDDLVVRGDALTASVRVTFVHELTHALQDQHFELDRKDLDDRDDEASQGFGAVVEGDAVRVQEMYLDSLPEEEQKAAEREEMEGAAGIDPTIPRILLELISFPYALGPDFARALVESGGQERLDEAFREPPITTEQIIHPDLYLEDGEEPRKVASPKTDREAKAIDQGVIGQLGMILVLNRLVDQRTAVIASQGWGGDRYVAWRDGDAACVRTNLVMDSAADAREMRDALRSAAEQRDRFDVSATPQVITFTSCG